MNNSAKLLLPPPNFDKKPLGRPKQNFLTRSGMTLLPREKKPPTMLGKQLLAQSPLPAYATKSNEPPTPPPTPPLKLPYCEGCDMELQSDEHMRHHRAAHERCPVDGCQFRGHALVMDKHVTVLHATGMFEKFKKLSTPEEIAAWRDERRKKYPSVANVQMLQAAKEQRQRRGERLEAQTSRFGKREDRKRTRDGNEHKKPAEAAAAEDGQVPNAAAVTEMPPRGKNDKRANKRRKMQQARQEVKPKEAEEKRETVLGTQEEEQCAGIGMFRGTSKLKDYKHAKTKKEPVATNALMGLLGMYGSDDDEDESENENEEKETEKKLISENSVIDNEISKEVVENVEKSEEIEEQFIIEEKRATAVTSVLNSEAAKINTPEAELPTQTTKVNSEEMPTVTKEINGTNASDNEAPDETPISHSSDFAGPLPKSEPVPSSNEPVSKRAKPANAETKKPPTRLIKRKSGLDYRKARVRKQNTMLEKLLETDIRHERNVLLQCVRYVCENRFFGVGQSAAKQSGT